MEFELAEGVPHHGDEAFLHEPMLFEPCECIVSEIAAPKWIHDNVGDVDDPGRLFALTSADQEGVIYRRHHPFNERSKLLRCRRRIHPWVMKLLAPGNGRYERRLVGRTNPTEIDVTHWLGPGSEAQKVGRCMTIKPVAKSISTLADAYRRRILPDTGG